MLKVANILVALFLAFAPGMDVVGLLHAVEACEIGAGVSHHHDHGHDHHHGDEQDPPPPQDCPHFENVPHGSPAMLVAAPVAVFLPGPPLCAAPDVVVAPVAAQSITDQDSRPPPWPALAGCIKLLI